MFNIKFIDTDSVTVNTVTKRLEALDMLSLVYTTYFRTSNFDEPLTNYNVNNVVIDLTDATEDTVDIDDLVLSILEASKCPIIKKPNDTQLLDIFNECVELYQLKYLPYETYALIDEPQLDNMMDYSVIDEIFNKTLNLRSLFNPIYYSTVAIIKDDKMIIGLDEFELDTFDFAVLPSHINGNMFTKLSNEEFAISKYLVTPIPFTLIDPAEITERVNTYKQKLFYKVMSLTAREVSKLPQAVANIFIKAGYVPLSALREYEEEIKKLID